MKCVQILFLFTVTGLAGCGKSDTKPAPEVKERPNIIYILADDLGYGDIGAFGQDKIETPNLDALAASGMIFTQHYSSAPVCAPARYMLMTGSHSGHAYIRGNDEWADRGEVWDYRAMLSDSTLEGQRPVPEGTHFFPMDLQAAGYRTGMIGKWGLGAPHTLSVPNEMGFDYYCGYNCQRQAHTYHPVHLYENRNRIYLDNDTIAPHERLPEGAEKDDEALYSRFQAGEYAPDVMFDRLSRFVKEDDGRPFFLYWATPIPHLALQAPKRWVDHYVQKFGDEEPYDGNGGYFPNRHPRATYAAMISYLDENVGKLIAQLKEQGIYENTLIIFTSDNGPAYNGGTDTPWFESAGPFSSEYGRGKGFVYEGGIRVPMIASWPGRIAGGSRSDHISAHYDVYATLAELLGFEAAENDGISFLPELLGEGDQSEHEFLYWEFPEYGGQAAIRMGKWKVVRRNLKNNEPATLELYDLEADPGETQNLAEQNTDVLKQAEEIFDREHEDAEVERFRIPVLERGLLADKEE